VNDQANDAMNGQANDAMNDQVNEAANDAVNRQANQPMKAQEPANTESDPRLEELRERLAAVRRRIDGAVAAAGRQEQPPRLIVVTKFHPAGDVRRLAVLGITDVGENRDQEAADKAAELAGLELRWHFIGQLQSNKAKSVVKYAHAVHSVDRPQLARALAKAMAAEQEHTGRAPLDCFIQVSLDDDAGGRRGGALPADVPALAEELAGHAGLHLAGVMAVAPFGADPAPAFEKLAELSARLTADHPGATAISAGMSQDLEQAIRFGATHLRIGSDILGPRPALR
jgi:pyridoxal phosphate enzyme (YggS family)